MGRRRPSGRRLRRSRRPETTEPAGRKRRWHPRGSTVTMCASVQPLVDVGTDVMDESPLEFDAFFQRHHPRLFAALCLTTGSRHEAEEIAQDAFLKLLERWDRVTQMDDPAGYLFTTAMNLFRKRYRRAKLASRLPLAQPRARRRVRDDRRSGSVGAGVARPDAAATGRDRPHDDPGRSFARGGQGPWGSRTRPSGCSPKNARAALRTSVGDER